MAAVLPLVFGDLAQATLELSAQHGQLELAGFITRPPAGTSSAGPQLLYVNKRCVACSEVSHPGVQFGQQLWRLALWMVCRTSC